MNLISRVDACGRWEAVYNAIEFEKYTLKEQVAEDAPLMFLGRIEKIKGAHTAIKVAKATGHKLIIAGNVSPLDDERSYFEKEIKPLIDDVQIQYVGAVNDEQKNFYLGQAKALLFPIEWNEPFGMVMIEAMACGTPVIGFRKGSVPEVITDGVTGFFTNDMEKMISAVSLIHSIDRKECRLISQSRFDITIIAKRYLQLFN
jgi:glycosyltransferase involved in cell wall biosynthesis